MIRILACCIIKLKKPKKVQWKTGGPNFIHHFGTQLKLKRKTEQN